MAEPGNTPQATPAIRPIERARMMHRPHVVATPVVSRPAKSAFKTTARENVRQFLSGLLPASPTPAPKLSEDLTALRGVVDAIRSAEQAGIINMDEADAVLSYITQCFTHRRLDEVLSKMATSQHASWFMVAHHAGFEA